MPVQASELTTPAMGKPAPNEKKYEAHIFLRLPSHVDRSELEQLVRAEHFRFGRPRASAADGIDDHILTRNDDVRDRIERSVRVLTALLRTEGFDVYRIRLEETVFDEIL